MTQMLPWLATVIVFLVVVAILEYWRMNVLPHNQFINNLFGGLYALVGFSITPSFKQELTPTLFWSVEICCAIGFIFYLHRLIKNFRLSSG